MPDNNILKKIEGYLVTIEERKKPHIVGSSDYDRGYADGVSDGQGKVAADIRAILQIGESKPLVLHGRCRVINGIWKEREGSVEYLGPDITGTREIAQVLLDGMDLPQDINTKDLQGL